MPSALRAALGKEITMSPKTRSWLGLRADVGRRAWRETRAGLDHSCCGKDRTSVALSMPRNSRFRRRMRLDPTRLMLRLWPATPSRPQMKSARERIFFSLIRYARERQATVVVGGTSKGENGSFFKIRLWAFAAWKTVWSRPFPILQGLLVGRKKMILWN